MPLLFSLGQYAALSAVVCFVQDQLSKLADRRSVLLERISLVDDLQGA